MVFDPRYFLRSHISSNKARLKDNRQTVESYQIAKENIKKDKIKLAMYSYVLALNGIYDYELKQEFDFGYKWGGK